MPVFRSADLFQRRLEHRMAEVARPIPDGGLGPLHMMVFSEDFTKSRIEPTIYHALYYANDTCDTDGCPRQGKKT